MFHLVENTYGRIENNLIKSSKMIDSWYSFFFNISALVIVFISLYFFLTAKVELPNESIEFKPQPWLNAVRNVPITDYGQIPQTEIRDRLQGFSYRKS
jgi:hypothetical protein